MDILNIVTAFVNSPATGDDFPVLPIVAVGGIAVVIAIVSAVAAAVKKKDDDDKE